MIEFIFTIFTVLGGSFIAALGILMIRAVIFSRRADLGRDARKEKSRRMDVNGDTSRYYVSPGIF